MSAAFNNADAKSGIPRLLKKNFSAFFFLNFHFKKKLKYLFCKFYYFFFNIVVFFCIFNIEIEIKYFFFNIILDQF